MLDVKKSLSVVLGLSLFLSCSAAECLAQPAKEQSKQESKDPAKQDWNLLVVLLYDQDCKVTCTKVKPAMQELAQKFGSKVKYVELNTNEETFADTVKTADSLGVKKFVNDSAEEVPIVAIFDTKKKRMKELQGFKTKDVYETAIQKALEKKS